MCHEDDRFSVFAPDGQPVHPRLPAVWRLAPERTEFRSRVLETVLQADGRVRNRWVGCRPLPEGDAWFETAWAAFRSGAIYAV